MKRSQEHAIAVALQMRETGRSDNDLLDRLAADPRLGITRAELDAALADPTRACRHRWDSRWRRWSAQIETIAAGSSRGGRLSSRPGAVESSREVSTVRTYLLLAAAEFRRYSTYRLAILAGVTTQSVFGFIRVSVLVRGDLYRWRHAGGLRPAARPRPTSGSARRCWHRLRIFGWIEIADRGQQRRDRRRLRPTGRPAAGLVGSRPGPRQLSSCWPAAYRRCSLAP